MVKIWLMSFWVWAEFATLISPNQWHYAHIGEWQRAFPEAKTWASPGVRRRA